ncbi:PLD nuclease N-terminal domain-containing protein [Nonomuraea sp. NPDC052116]|uniref:PLD nuclease N-terminal domain-containing protein n=1 Tax=Nonomuraea sp. NPDC052116 TaxID=3155665 RepID=UPI0034236A6F
MKTYLIDPSTFPWGALIPVLAIELALDAYVIVDAIRHPRVRNLPRWAWVLLTLFANPFGAIAYILAGRSHDR